MSAPSALVEAEPVAPWLEPARQSLLERHRSGRMPHALLFAGADGVGKRWLAERLAADLLCESSTETACGQCRGCKLRLAGSHPDFRWFGLEEGDSTIKIESIRQLVEWLQLTPQYETLRIAVVDCADTMTRQAANSLLKTLEEPAERTVIILLSAKERKLPITVRSRCQRYALHAGPTRVVHQWLAEHAVEQPETALAVAGGAPLHALAIADSDLQARRDLLMDAWSRLLLGKSSIARIVESVESLPVEVCLRHFLQWTADIIKLRLAPASMINHEADRDVLLPLCDALQTDDWFTLYDKMRALYRIDSASFKTRTVLEGVFADICLSKNTV